MRKKHNQRCSRRGLLERSGVRTAAATCAGCLTLSVAAGQPVAAQKAFRSYEVPQEEERALAIGQDFAGNVCTAGSRTWAPEFDRTDMLIAKHDAAGVIQWVKTFSYTLGFNRATAMRVLADGTVLLVGEVEDRWTPSSPREVIFMQLASDGTLTTSWLLPGTRNTDPVHGESPGPAIDYDESANVGYILTNYLGRPLLHKFTLGLMPTEVREFVYSEPARAGVIALTVVDPHALGKQRVGAWDVNGDGARRATTEGRSAKSLPASAGPGSGAASNFTSRTTWVSRVITGSAAQI